MDIATIIGLLMSGVLIAGSVLYGGSPQVFLNLPSVLVVFGGTLGATLVKNPLPIVLRTFAVVGKAFVTRLPEPPDLIEQILELTKEARKKSIVALEEVEIEYDFLAKGVGMCVDGVEVEKIRAVLNNDIRSMVTRHKTGREVLEGMGQAAPAFGMVGTLIGLVQMLTKLDDPAAIGPAMAVALLTTLYGALLANVVFLPLAGKLKVLSEQELQLMLMCVEGIAGMAAAENPTAIDQRLKAFIAPNLRDQTKAA
jgi:chemotaxis protein MotA